MKRRTCPVGPDICGEIVGWEAFLAHIYSHHTSGTEAERLEQAEALLKRGRTGKGPHE